MLFTRTEAPNAFHQATQQGVRRQCTMSPQRFDQPLLSELLSCIVKGFSDAIGVECQGVSWPESAFFDCAIPFFEESHRCASGIEPFKLVIVTQQKGREMPAVCVAQALQFVVIFGEKERGIRLFGGIFVEEPVY